MENYSTQHYQTPRLSLWWKILITLNIIFDVPILFSTFTGYQWNCKYNGFPELVIALFTAITALTLVWALVRSAGKNRKVLDVVITGLFSVLLGFVICFLSLALLYSYLDPSGPNPEAAVPSPNSQRIAKLCAIDCGPSCPTLYELRVGYRFSPSIDLRLVNLNSLGVSYPAPQIKWADGNTINVVKADGTTRVFHADLARFDLQSAFFVLIYVGIKYGYTTYRLREQG